MASRIRISARPRGHTAGLLTIGTVAAGVVNYAYTLLMTHRLTTSEFSVFAGAQSLVLVVGIVSGAAVPWVLARESAVAAVQQDTVRLRQAINFAFWANMGVGVVASVVTGAIVASFGSSVDALLVAGTSLVLCVASTGLGLLQGRGRTTALAALVVSEVVVKFGVGLVLVSRSQPSAGGALGGALAGACVLLVALGPAARCIGLPRSLHTDRSLWRAAGRIGVLQVGVSVIASLDTILAAALPSLRGAAAGYQLASTIGKVPMFISSAVSTAVFPTLVPGNAFRGRVQALRLYAVTSGFIWLALLTAPGDVIRGVFPADYGSITQWLPYTASLGVALGLLNLLTTFVQSRTTPGHSPPSSGFTAIAWALSSTTAVMVLGAALDGVRGLAIGALSAGWLAAWLFGLLATERRALGAVPWRRSGRVRRAVLMAAVPAVMVVARPVPALWFAVVLAAACLVAVAAFPEFRAFADRVGRGAARSVGRR